MATITGLTAERMLEIEAASVVDGDVSGNDLILTRKDGSIINAGNVRGPAGPTGPMGSSLAVVTARDILEVGQLNQIRAGRQLTSADFTSQGLNAPLGLWNLSNFSDSSGNGRSLTNKGSVPLGVGINGIASTAAAFSGSTAQALYIPDDASGTLPGAAFRLRHFTTGCWFRSAKAGVQQMLIAKDAASPQFGWNLYIQTGNLLTFTLSSTGSDSGSVVGNYGNVVDDRWHFVCLSFDGAMVKLWYDGVMSGSVIQVVPIWQSTGPLNIGARRADASVAGIDPFYGRIDEVFITQDVLEREHINNLMAASIPHALGAAPSNVSVQVRRKRRGGALAVTDFPSQPVRLYNFTGGVLTDQGSNNVPVTNAGVAPVLVPGADGLKDGAFEFGIGASATQHFVSTDAGLPAGLNARSYGCWIKRAGAIQAGGESLLGWGTIGTNDARLYIRNTDGALVSVSGADSISTWAVNDNRWHFAVVVEDNASADGVKRKIYTDGRLVSGSTVMNSITLAGAGRFRIGAGPDGSSPLVYGMVDAPFVFAGALTAEQIRVLFNVGPSAMQPTLKAAADHIEGIESGRLLTLFDSLESNSTIDLSVAA